VKLSSTPLTLDAKGRPQRGVVSSDRIFADPTLGGTQVILAAERRPGTSSGKSEARDAWNDFGLQEKHQWPNVSITLAIWRAWKAGHWRGLASVTLDSNTVTGADVKWSFVVIHTQVVVWALPSGEPKPIGLGKWNMKPNKCFCP